MTDREKLVEVLIDAADHACEICNLVSCGDCPGNSDKGCTLSLMADYLLAHGVTVREPGEWIWHEEEFKYECSACNCRFDYNHTFGIFDHGFEYGSFCPNCGAKMEGE